MAKDVVDQLTAAGWRCPSFEACAAGMAILEAALEGAHHACSAAPPCVPLETNGNPAGRARAAGSVDGRAQTHSRPIRAPLPSA